MQNSRIAQEENPVETGIKTVLLAILTGVGIAIGFMIVNKATVNKTLGRK